MGHSDWMTVAALQKLRDRFCERFFCKLRLGVAIDQRPVRACESLLKLSLLIRIEATLRTVVVRGIEL